MKAITKTSPYSNPNLTLTLTLTLTLIPTPVPDLASQVMMLWVNLIKLRLVLGEHHPLQLERLLVRLQLP